MNTSIKYKTLFRRTEVDIFVNGKTVTCVKSFGGEPLPVRPFVVFGKSNGFVYIRDAHGRCWMELSPEAYPNVLFCYLQTASLTWIHYLAIDCKNVELAKREFIDLKDVLRKRLNNWLEEKQRLFPELSRMQVVVSSIKEVCQDYVNYTGLNITQVLQLLEKKDSVDGEWVELKCLSKIDS